MALGAYILDFQPLNPSNIDSIDFSYPMDNGIRILSPDYLTLSLRPPYYGDEVNLKFWKLLGLMFGAAWTPPPAPLTRQPGYRYVYNHSTREFDAYDASGTNFVHITGIDSMADMNIDFTIYKSHQFEIIINPEDLGGSRFIFPAHLVKKILDGLEQKPFDEGVQNIYLPDRLRPYGAIDFDNPYFEIQHIGDIIVNNFGKTYFKNLKKKTYELNGSLHYFWDIDWEKNAPMNYFYLAEDSPFTSKKLLQIMRSQQLSGDILLPILSSNMFPDLMPVERAGETQNNRPVYEPWLILGWLSFLYNHRTVDLEDDFVIPIFDLSPRFA